MRGGKGKDGGEGWMVGLRIGVEERNGCRGAKYLAVLAMAEGCSGFVGGGEVDFVSDLAAVAMAGVDHFDGAGR